MPHPPLKKTIKTDDGGGRTRGTKNILNLSHMEEADVSPKKFPKSERDNFGQSQKCCAGFDLIVVISYSKKNYFHLKIKEITSH